MLKQCLNSTFLVAIAGFLALPALAAPMSASEMALAIRESKIVGPKSSLLVVQSPDQQEVTIITNRSKMTSNDCKIKAVLMAKALMDLQPKQLAAVKVIYTIDGDTAVDKVVVGAGDVQAFASGTITEAQLMLSLDLRRESGDGSDGAKTSVVAGPQKERRDILQSRIETLKQGGTGVAPFQKMFDEIEELTKAGKAKEASLLISDLSTKLSSQESLRDQAKRVGAGGGVKGQQGTHSASSADLGARQPWKPGGTGGNTAQATDFQSHAGWLKNKLDEMERRGTSVSDLRSRLKDVENQSSKLSPNEVSARLDEIKAKMMQQDRQSKFPNAGLMRQKFNGRN